MEFLLFLTAFILIIAFAPIGFSSAIIKSLILWDFSYLKKYYYNVAASLDQLGNVIMAPLFNLILIKSSPFQFGDKDETISSVLGRNQLNKSLRYLGKRLVALLDWIDKDHSVKSIGS